MGVIGIFELIRFSIHPDEKVGTLELTVGVPLGLGF